MPIFSFKGYALTELFRKPHNFINNPATFYTSNDVSLKRVEKKKSWKYEKTIIM